MERFCISLVLMGMALSAPASAGEEFPSDVVPTASGELAVTFIGHGSLLFSYAGKTVYVDPFGKLADYGALPKADLILITHEHRDHFDSAAIGKIRAPGTQIVLTGAVARELGSGTVMGNGDSRTVAGLTIDAVPAYNLVHKRDNGEPFHPPGRGNGYVIAFGGKRVYVAGDTENIPEMKALGNIDIAFLPMNLPYTMTPEMVAEAAKLFHPRVLYPYHTGDTDLSRIADLLKKEKGIEVRLRRMQ